MEKPSAQEKVNRTESLDIDRIYRCPECDGTGEVAIDIDDGEGHTERGVGTKKCICKLTTDEI